ASLMTRLGETPHLVQSHALLNTGKNILIAAFVADQVKAQTRVLEELNRIVINVRAAVARPGQPKRRELLGDLPRAGQVSRKCVVIEEELTHLGKKLLHVRHLIRDVLRRAHPVFMATNGLRPKAEGALGGTAPARVKADVRMQQVTDEVFLDLQIALIDVCY